MFKKILTFLFAVIISTPAWPQASLLPNAKQTFVDINGAPLASGTVDMYVPNTTTRKSTWTNSGETALNTNPIQLDAAGRAVIYGQGVYRQVVKDNIGNPQWDALTTAPSSGSSVFLTDAAPIGTILPFAGNVIPANYLPASGEVISRTVYAELMAAIVITKTGTTIALSGTISGITDTSQIKIGAPIEGPCISFGTIVTAVPSSTSITLSGLATSTGSCSLAIFPFGNGNGVDTFNVPNMLGKAPVGRDDTGTVLTTASCASPAGLGFVCGSQLHTMTLGELVAHTHTSPAISANPHTHFEINADNVVSGTLTGANQITQIASAGGAAQAYTLAGSATGATLGLTSSTTVTLNVGANTGSTGSTTPFPLLQPSLMVNWIIKYKSESPSGAGGVISIGGMTGDILCGSGVICSGQTITFAGSGSGTVVGDGATVINQFAVWNDTFATHIKNFDLFGTANTFNASGAQIFDTSVSGGPAIEIGVNKQICFFNSGTTCGHIIQRQASDGSLLIGGGQSNIVFNAANPVTIGSVSSAPGILTVGGLSQFMATSASTTPGFITTGEAANFFSGSNASPFTNSQNPTVFIGRTEQLVGTGNITTGALLVVNSAIAQNSGGAAAQQTTALNAIAQKDIDSTGDVAAIQGIAVSLANSGEGGVFGGFFKAVMATNFSSAIAVETSTDNHSGVSTPYDPTNLTTKGAYGFDIAYNGQSTGAGGANGTVAVKVRGDSGGFGWDVGYSCMGTSGFTDIISTCFQDDSHAVNVLLFNSGAHAYGIKGTGATYSTAAIAFPGFTVDGSGNMTVTSCTGCAGGTATLTNTHIFVGNASNIATDVALSGDATIANTGLMTIASAAVSYAKIANLGALAIMGRSANSSGVGADIQATAASGAVLRESGSTIGFGTIATAGIANNAVTLAKLATQATNTVLANVTSGTAVPTAFAVSSCDTATKALGWTTNTGFVCNSSITAAAVPVGGITGLGTGVATALAVNVGSAGAFVTFNGALGTPSSGTVTNLTGTASININGTVGATTPGTGAFTALGASGNFAINTNKFNVTAASGNTSLAGTLTFSAQANIVTGPGFSSSTGNTFLLAGGTAGYQANNNAGNVALILIDDSGHYGNYTNVSGVSVSPALTSCGTSPAISGSDSKGTVTMGTVNPAGCVITFAATYTTVPDCTVTWQSNLVLMQYVITATAITLTQTPTSSNKINYTCQKT